MKLLGAVILTISASAFGIIKAAEIKKRATVLMELITFFEYMRNEICTRRAPIKSILCGADKLGLSSVLPFVCELNEKMKRLGELSFSRIWSDSAERKLPCLSDQQLMIIKELGTSIGRYDAELQAAGFDRCIASLQHEHEQISDNIHAEQKMYIGLGTGAGLIISIVLI